MHKLPKIKSIILFIWFFILLFFPQIALSENTINWTPQIVQEAVATGGSKEFTAVFISSADLNNVTLRVTPELQPYIKLEKTHFETIKANIAHKLKIYFFVPYRTNAGHYEGTIRLLGGYKIFLQSLKVKLIVFDINSPQKIMSDFKDALEVGDIDKMVKDFHSSIQEDYRKAFISAKNEGGLLEIFQDFRTLEEVYVKDNLAKYKIRVNENGEIFTYYIYLIKDRAGNWKIYSM